jgi:DNA polymerase-3 subunit alpha
MDKFNIDNLNLGVSDYQTNDNQMVDIKDEFKTNNANTTLKPFAHLHLHTFHSILDGCGSIDNYIKLAKRFHHPAIAITDHGTLSGTFEFYRKCKSAGIKPIIGFEAYVNDKMGDFEEKSFEGGNAHQIILVKNKQGFINANRLAYKSFTEGFYRRGRIKTEWLFKYKEGLIITTSCIGSLVGKLLKDKKNAEAEMYFKRLKDEFGEDFYAEIQLNELNIQKNYNSFIIEMASKYNVKIIITADVHYAFPEDAELQDTLLAINGKRQLGHSFKFDVRSLYYSSSEDIYNFNYKFGYDYRYDFIDSCLENTLEIADKCNFDFEIGIEKFPKYEPTEDVIKYCKSKETPEIIKKIAFSKLKQKLNKYKENGIVKLNDEKISEYVNRLNYELSVIEEKKMLDYFLVNWEIIRYYREKGYDVGPGRGSAAGCLLTWCLDITKIDPIRFGLYFERFLNPTRMSPPDLDVDYMSDTRHITEEFLVNKYGKDRILHVSTFSTFNEKGCLKDVVRAHYGEEATGYESVVFKVTKEMPEWSKVDYTLKDWFEQWPKEKECSPEVRQWLTDPANKKIIEQTLKLQGQIRGVGQHAAGVVITPTECWNDVPTNIIASNKSVVTAFSEADGSDKDLSKLGILKLDMLSLETLNVIKEAVELIKKSKGIDLTDTVDYLNLEDTNIYAELRLGLNQGVFQFESPGMNSLVKGIKVENFTELVAANALFRPGPMRIGAHQDYAKNKFKPDEIKYLHPSLESILGESNGVLIFQEQVMFIANKIGGMSLGEGDMLRRYMDKAAKFIDKEIKGEILTENEKNSSDYKSFSKFWNKFLEGATKNGYQKEVMEEIKNWMIKYLGYSFNKSHCVCYGYIACQTLYLKHYYPTEFYTSLLNHVKSNNDKEKEKQWIASAIASAMSKGIKFAPPSKKSGWNWTMTGEKEISMGFSGINGLGDKAYSELMTLLEKNEETLETIKIHKFFNLPFSTFNKKAFEVCVKAGVFDDWSESREYLIELKNKKKKKEIPGQLAIFDLNAEEFNPVIKNNSFITTTPIQKVREFVEVCNFDLQKIEEMANIKLELYKQAGRIIESILNFSENDYYFFYLDSVQEAVSEKGGNYLNIKVGDGISTTSLRVFPARRKVGTDIYDVIKANAQSKGVYVSEFVKNVKGFINFKTNAKFKRIK